MPLHFNIEAVAEVNKVQLPQANKVRLPLQEPKFNFNTPSSTVRAVPIPNHPKDICSPCSPVVLADVPRTGGGILKSSDSSKFRDLTVPIPNNPKSKSLSLQKLSPKPTLTAEPGVLDVARTSGSLLTSSDVSKFHEISAVTVPNYPKRKSLSLQSAGTDTPSLKPTLTTEPVVLDVPRTSGGLLKSSDFSKFHELPSALKDILPHNVQYILLSYREVGSGTNQFFATLRTTIGNKEEALQWKADFQYSSMTDFTTRDSHDENTPKLVFKKKFKCFHNTGSSFPSCKTKTPHYKHTNCHASFILTVKNKDMRRSKDPLLKTHPCEISISHIHNHPIECADSLRHRKPNADVVKKFKELLARGHSPSSALETHKFELQEEHQDLYWKALGDGSLCPSLMWCYRLYYDTFQKTYGPPTGDGMIESLKTAIEEYNKRCGSICSVGDFEGDYHTIAICSPLMKRVHKYLPTAAEMAFIDSTGNMDRHGSRIFVMTAPSVAGALPVGLFITNSESEAAITKGLKCLKEILPEDSFYGRKEMGPAIIMTDDSSAERNSLKNIWPFALLLFCIFHVLKSVWSYLWDSENGVRKSERSELYFPFKDLLRSPDKSTFDSRWSDLNSGEGLISKHPKILSYYKKKVDRASEWALCHRQDVLTRDNDTNNNSEITMKILIELIMKRCKAFSVVQLHDFLTNPLESYYERRLATLLANRVVNMTRSKYYIPPQKLEPLECTRKSEELFEVTNTLKKSKYIVNMDCETCTCPVGCHGKPCKHLAKVAQQFQLSTLQLMPTNDPEAKKQLHLIMTGTLENVPAEWYSSIRPDQDRGSQVEIDCGGADNLNCAEADEQSQNLSATQTSSDTDFNVCLQDIKGNLEFLLEKFKENPEVFLPAMVKFHKRFSVLKASEPNLLSALHTFGRPSGPAAIRSGKRIPVQSTSVARRKSGLGGRRAIHSGRPTKVVSGPDHCYSSQSAAQKRHSSAPVAWHMPPKKRSKVGAPHNIGHCTTVRLALPKN